MRHALESVNFLRCKESPTVTVFVSAVVDATVPYPPEIGGATHTSPLEGFADAIQRNALQGNGHGLGSLRPETD